MEIGVPVVAQTRDGRQELVHHGNAAYLKAGEFKFIGSPESATYWRSAAKLLQAHVSYGFAKKLGISEQSLAVACGSHASEPEHCQAVNAMLEAASLTEGHLQCGTHAPWSKYAENPASGRTAIHHNCSGKHAMMLAACKAQGWPLDSYLDASHPLQVAIEGEIVARGGQVVRGNDGCGLATYWLTLEQQATIFASLAGSPTLAAIAAHPQMVAGTRRFCSDLAAATGGNIIGKYGALGVYNAINVETGDALAVKATTGDEKACTTFAANLMVKLGWLDPAAQEQLAWYIESPNKNNHGKIVGSLHAIFEI